MKSKVILLSVVNIFVLVSANPTGSSNELETLVECQDLKVFNIPKVDCSSEGITVHFNQLGLLETELVIKNYLDDPICGKNYTSGENNGTFFVKYGTCGVELTNRSAEFNMIVYRPPREIRKSAQIRSVKCDYPLKQEVAKNRFKVGGPKAVTDLPSTSIVVPDPTHELMLVNSDNERVTKAEPGELIIGKLCVSPKSYFGFLKNCYFTPDPKDEAKKYPIVNETGCPTDPDVSPWTWNSKNNCAQLPFKAFKLLDWNEIHLLCDVHYCTQENDCKPPNCPDATKPCSRE